MVAQLKRGESGHASLRLIESGPMGRGLLSGYALLSCPVIEVGAEVLALPTKLVERYGGSAALPSHPLLGNVEVSGGLTATHVGGRGGLHGYGPFLFCPGFRLELKRKVS